MTDIYNEIILEHYQHPFNKKELKEFTIAEEGVNPSCGDQLKIFILLENNQIKDISFTGQGCSISMASASILNSIILEYKKLQEQKEIIKQVIEYIKTGKLINKNLENTDIIAFNKIHQYPVRIKCALLPWITLQNILEKITT